MRHPPAIIATWQRHSAAALLVCAALGAACLSLAGAPPASGSAAGPGPVSQALPEHPGARIVADRGSAGSVRLGGSPGVPAANPGTNTVYVPIQCTTSQCTADTHFVDVVNAAKCNSKIRSDCRVIARARVGTSPLAATVDQRTDTIYVVNGGSNDVSVLSGARCNAKVTRGCGRPVATIKVGKFPVAAALDPKTRTLYVASPDGHIFVINAAGCNAVTTRGCRRHVRAVKDNLGPQAVDVDVATDTVYAVNDGTGNGDTVSVIDGAVCNGATGRGCGRTPRTITVGNGAFWDTVDQSTDTVYVTNYNDGTVSVINGARCNATVNSGCGQRPPSVTTGAGAAFVAVDSRLHTLFTVNQNDDTLSEINTRTCDARVTTGCRRLARNQRAAPDRAPGYAPFPGAVALMPKTGTAYVLNVGGAGVMSVTGVSRCNAADTAGCRRPAPRAPVGALLTAVDPVTDTIYAGDLNRPVIDVINGATCRARHVTVCTPVAMIPMPDPDANVGAIDSSTRTLYASDEATAGTVAVINTGICNARNTSGCGTAPPEIRIGAFPGPPALNQATHTLYVSYGATADMVAVVSTVHCNAASSSGCGQTPPAVTVGAGTSVVAVSVATDTVYAPASGPGQFDGHTMALINGATCNGTSHAGCSRLAAKVRVGVGPVGVVVDDHTHTVYVANNADGDAPGTVSVINSATCNATRTTGCHHFAVMATGISPQLIALDAATRRLYVSDFAGAAVSILDTARCDASITAGCAVATTEQAVGPQPLGVAVNPVTSSVYVTSLFQAGSLFVLSAPR